MTEFFGFDNRRHPLIRRRIGEKELSMCLFARSKYVEQLYYKDYYQCHDEDTNHAFYKYGQSGYQVFHVDYHICSPLT